MKAKTTTLRTLTETPKMRCLLAALALAATLPAAAVQTSEILPINSRATSAAIDTVTGRVFIANGATGRSTDGLVTVLERNGTYRTLVPISGPMDVAVSSKHRKVVVPHGVLNMATIIDADTLAMTTVPTGVLPFRTVIVEATGMAYVMNKGRNQNSGPGSITQIDLRTNRSETFDIPDFGPVDIAANEAGTRVYVVGTHYFRTAEWMPGFIQVFDTTTKSFIGGAVRLGRMAQQVFVSATTDDVYVVGHTELLRTLPWAGDIRANSIRPALYVLGAADLAVRRVIDLPDTTNLDLFGPLLQGASAIDTAANTVYVVDSPNRKLSVVSPSSGAVRTVALEDFAAATAVNPKSGYVVVSYNLSGKAALFSLDGERLDTVPIGNAPRAGEYLGNNYRVAVNSTNGDTYVTNGHEGAIALLRGRDNAEAAAVLNVTDLWHNPSEPGWGVFLDQQGTTLFAALFTYTAAGEPTWLVMSNGARQLDGSFSGELYRARGPLATGKTSVESVGILRFQPGDANAGTLSYSVGSLALTKSVERFRFSAALRDCSWSTDPQKAALDRMNFTSLWWNPAESGWGLALSHQGNTTFGVLFTYDEQDRPSWYVMSSGVEKTRGQFGGVLYRAGRGRIEEAGFMSLAFSTGNDGVLKYRADGADIEKSITRQTFSMLTTHCSS
jgi:DNA-binding beta-propeller fold protein YncE